MGSFVGNKKQQRGLWYAWEPRLKRIIAHENLTLRNRINRLNRKILGYSKSAKMHDKIIGTFIEREYSV
ncbi:transposase [Xenorhabdus bovienii str. kraussei Becker Underwood]|uniref:Transposase n=1 Tax=Xenorhabdus bovienii str. kraussei Becker Underwood TaxID=1398204 RepID=A0A077Q3L9_XENBV|nr:transposase [Xenorhabdus bovienii str. kraussei Becker Underwood]